MRPFLALVMAAALTSVARAQSTADWYPFTDTFKDTPVFEMKPYARPGAAAGKLRCIDPSIRRAVARGDHPTH